MNMPMTALRTTAPMTEAHPALQSVAAVSYWVDVNKLLAAYPSRTARANIMAELDSIFPLTTGSHTDVKEYVIYFQQLLAFFDDGSSTGLQNPGQLTGFSGSKNSPASLLLQQGGLRVELELSQQGLDNLMVETTNSPAGQDGPIIPTLEALLQTRAAQPMAMVNRVSRTFRAVDGEDFETHNRQWI